MTTPRTELCATRVWPPQEPDEESRMGGGPSFAWDWRVMAVAVAWSMPGVLVGALARLYLPDGGPVPWWVAGGAALGVTCGALLEADHEPV